MATADPEHAHALALDAVRGALDVDDDGLDSPDAAERLVSVGPNELPPPKRPPAIVRLLSHFNDVLIYVLLGAAVIEAILGGWLDFWVIVAVAVINAVIGFVQEGRAERALAGIRDLLAPDANVRRDGAWRVVPAAELVPGDLIRVGPGDKVPADVRLVAVTRLRIDESALTGESEPTSKQTDAVDAGAGVGDRHSMAFSGTLVTGGQGEGYVTATGASTQIGRIQRLVSEAGSITTPLSRQLAVFSRVLTLAILAVAAAMMLVGRYVHDIPYAELIGSTVGFAVAAIPEGLPALVTITLAIGVQQMAKRNAITRKLPAVETLGAVTTICSDKTGTLTRNEMTVRRIVSPSTEYDVDGLGYEPVGVIRPVGTARDGADGLGEAVASALPIDLRRLLEVAALCNDADVSHASGRWVVVGEPTDGALDVLARKVGFDERLAPRIASVPFDSELKLMAVLVEMSVGERMVLVKGAPDRLLARSTSQADGAGDAPLDRARWEAIVDELGDAGLRVLAAAARPARAGSTADPDALHEDDLDDLGFLGLFGIVDPPRPEAVAAIADCHDAGIRVKMITGDHSGTARAIAREMGIASDERPRVLTGADLERLSQDQLKEVVRDVDVYARTSPEHKIRIVRALQSHGEVVAMTGDGVNDAPAGRCRHRDGDQGHRGDERGRRDRARRR